MSILKIVLTGTDGSGKTTAAKVLAAELASVVVPVPEAATTLFDRLRIDKMLTFTERDVWQRAVTGLQLVNEQTAEYEALRTGKRALLCDRGIADGSAYFTRGWQDFMPLVGMRPEEVVGRYHLVLFFEPPDEATYYRVMELSNRVPRNYGEVRMLSDRTYQAWTSYRPVVTVPSMPSFDEKLDAAREHIKRFLEL